MTGLSRGRGIRIFDSLPKIMDYILASKKQFVVQKYIERPMVILKRKFDLRQWVIVQDFNPPRI